MWPKLLQILNDGNTTFLSLHTANMEIGSVSCYKKLTRFQTDHISTLTWRQISQSISTLPLLFSKKKRKPASKSIPTRPWPLRSGSPVLWDTAATEPPGAGQDWSQPTKTSPQTGNCQHSTTRSGSRHLLAELTNCILQKNFKINAPLFDEELVNFLSFEGKVVLENSKHPQEQSHWVLFEKQHRKSRR